jgi:copper oxidase (laccase) domain-containing protein
VIIHEAESGMVALVHAGWRGTTAGIVPRAVARLVRETGGRASLLRAGIGPGICAGCYEVGEDVVQAAWRAGLGSHVSADADLGRTRFDIAGALRAQLLAAGLREERIEVLGRCTFEDPDLPSFRRDHDAFRSAAVVALDRAATSPR